MEYATQNTHQDFLRINNSLYSSIFIRFIKNLTSSINSVNDFLFPVAKLSFSKGILVKGLLKLA